MAISHALLEGDLHLRHASTRGKDRGLNLKNLGGTSFMDDLSLDCFFFFKLLVFVLLFSLGDTYLRPNNQ